VEFAARAGNKDSARGIAFAVFYALHDPSRLAAFRAIGALGGVHDFLAVCRFGDLSHDSIFSWDVGFPRPYSAAANAAGNLGRHAKEQCVQSLQQNDRNNMILH
jgi:hypothetical protein